MGKFKIGDRVMVKGDYFSWFGTIVGLPAEMERQDIYFIRPKSKSGMVAVPESRITNFSNNQ